MKIDFINGPKNRPVNDREADDLVAAIVQCTRNHRDIKRGASVRGAIAFSQVLEGFTRLNNGFYLPSLEKAAVITLAPRIELTNDCSRSPEEIILNIVKDIVSGRHEDEPDDDTLPEKPPKKLTFDEFIAALQDKSLAQTFNGEAEDDGSGNIRVVDRDGNKETSDQPLERDSRYINQMNWFPDMQDALKDLIGELEQKLVKGEISETDFRYQKKKLEDMLNAASYLDAEVTDDEIAATVMEIMNASDSQWQKEMDFRDMYVYYHIREAQRNDALYKPKKNWYALKVIIDYLDKQGFIKSDKEGTKFILTAKAVNIVMKNLMTGKAKQDAARTDTRRIKKNATERRQDTRHFISGDVFRDISVRRTLREIARRNRKPSEINRHDLRVFLKEQLEQKKDIMLCIDSSGSMGFHGKLTLARLTAAAIAGKALENGDRVGVVTFDDLGRSALAPTDRKTDVITYLSGVAPGGNTNIGDGLRCAVTLLKRERSRNRKVVMLITDGEPTAISTKDIENLGKDDKKDMTGIFAVREARQAYAGGIETSVVHVTGANHTGRKLAEDISKAGHGEFRSIVSSDDLRAVVL